MAGRNNCDANANILDLILYVFFTVLYKAKLVKNL